MFRNFLANAIFENFLGLYLETLLTLFNLQMKVTKNNKKKLFFQNTVYKWISKNCGPT